ncbi:MFS transporter [Burkholderia pseudomallei]|uniref:MFS transporter n=2 Tax=Burkholderia pseudomallei TaxID=28450 RepID=UPI0005153650|nr:MFS transporter [Burkholderia pseudomallei]AIS89509.1 major Facilitator Superfamily protein [Burkholderia pseudomallei NAU35A-3]MBM5690393.1 MFS transporter [Burkholderia pseudomallei]OMR81505.1 MFS sugar transporter [Burkholderia pseudomallei]OMS90308.1 MFS sugar transporter [Burkholderia pseudomallei]OMV06865.1 MFS sugar transporter [Burkholderia pseudomallei]
MPLALLALTISAFAIGTTEFVIVGLIPTIASDLGVSLPSAGLLVSLYALSVAIGAPLITALTGRVPRKTLLAALMALFTLGNLVAWRAPGYESLIVARILTGLAHGVFFSVGSIIAMTLVPKDKAASAIATMFSGMTVAFVAGIPLGTFVGQHFGWRATFLIVALFGLVAFVGAAGFVPRDLAQTPPAPLARQLRVLAEPRLLLVFAMTAIGYGGSLIAFTYMAPLLERLAGFTPPQVSLALVGYGVSVAFGNVWGGKLADRIGPVGALKRIFLLLALVLLALTFTVHHAALAVPTMLAWGAVAFGNVPGLQVYVVKQARHFAPHAADVASGLNIAAFNLGVAGGSSLGGLIVAHAGLGHTPWIAAVVTLGAFALSALSGALDRRDGLPARTAEPVGLTH